MDPNLSRGEGSVNSHATAKGRHREPSVSSDYKLSLTIDLEELIDFWEIKCPTWYHSQEQTGTLSGRRCKLPTWHGDTLRAGGQPGLERTLSQETKLNRQITCFKKFNATYISHCNSILGNFQLFLTFSSLQSPRPETVLHLP